VRKMRIIAILLAVLMTVAILPIASPAMAATTTTTVNYTADHGSVISNPERGYHNRYEIIVDKTVNPYVDASLAIPGFVGDASAPDYLEFKRAKAAGNVCHAIRKVAVYNNQHGLPFFNKVCHDSFHAGASGSRKGYCCFVLCHHHLAEPFLQSIHKGQKLGIQMTYGGFGHCLIYPGIN